MVSYELLRKYSPCKCTALQCIYTIEIEVWWTGTKWPTPVETWWDQTTFTQPRSSDPSRELSVRARKVTRLSGILSSGGGGHILKSRLLNPLSWVPVVNTATLTKSAKVDICVCSIMHITRKFLYYYTLWFEQGQQLGFEHTLKVGVEH